MEIETLVLGDFQTNCYVVWADGEATECLVIDPGLSAEPLLALLKDKELTPTMVLLTHAHVDHVDGLRLLREAYPQIEVVIGADEAAGLSDPMGNLSGMLGAPTDYGEPQRLLEAGDAVELGAVRLETLATPGHTVGGVSLYCAAEKVVFTGDALFNGSIGRHDFPGGDLNTLLAGIREQIFMLPDETRVLSGHGPETTVGQEKRSNPFF